MHFSKYDNKYETLLRIETRFIYLIDKGFCPSHILTT